MKTETVGIESLAYGGDGVGHLADGRVVFVAGGLPGDAVEVRYADDGERFVKTHAEQVVEPSALRVVPPCAEAASGRCGGCPWACLSYDEQLRWKRRALVDALVRIAKVSPDSAERLVGECRASTRQWNYRNKIELEVGQDVAGRFTLGMHARGGEFVPLSTCRLIDSKLAKAPKALTGSLRYVQGSDDLGIERVGLRHSARTGSTEVAIWTSPGRFPRAAAAKVIPQSLPVKHIGVSRVLVKGQAAKRKVSGVESLAGRGFWAETLGAYSMAISAPSFFQVNTSGAETLMQLVREGLRPGGLDRILDLYSGAGTFTLPLAEEAGAVVAVEMAGSSVRDLRRNLERNDIAAEVIGGDVARELDGIGMVDKVVVDPPRSGLAPDALRGLIDASPRLIAYVSCDPSTLARDVGKLASGGYELRSATPVDLFPQTYHVETVAILERARR